MAPMRRGIFLATALTLASLSACTLTGPLSTPAGAGAGAPAGVPPPPAPGSPAPIPGTATPAPPGRPGAAPPRQFRLGAATTALVSQAHAQAQGGDFGPAAATLERAQRIEPDNPLLWIELGRVRLAENNPAQADAMGRKALALATGDASAQGAAWHLIGDSLRARGRNAEAAEADQRAQGPVLR